VLCLLPIALLVAMNLLQPGYTKPLFEDPTGRKMVMVAGGMMVVGVLVIRKIVNFKV
jgi:tight adherence protein B